MRCSQQPPAFPFTTVMGDSLLSGFVGAQSLAAVAELDR
jgi:hypothetical protein